MKNSLPLRSPVVWGLLLLPGLLCPSQAAGACRYFRVSYHLMQCKEVSDKDLKDLERSEIELPEIEEQDQGKLLRVRCSCDYTLSGSDPLCDFDRTDEQTSLVGAETGTDPCQKGKTLCDTVCARERQD